MCDEQICQPWLGCAFVLCAVWRGAHAVRRSLNASCSSHSRRGQPRNFAVNPR
ncbi:hypothetical protein PR003_g32613 [Phytophthora rubi]|uniref:Uncharacterized protein n=1 Tax=Phytophthora rubi TaxID=129364 RepID=A0A6A3GKI1_9STRA|nr:hypothetical protein PR002_g31826 [Phytophthora rubi]KAE8956927.1 hypothetical protein PR001_g31560 [Phytophthora rubi]KAE9264962.1 hypothetical protein PR003_g32613 [Phytophthora rubi]